MVGRRRRLGKLAPVRFAEPPWTEEHPDWIRFDRELPADHSARQIVAAMQLLDLTPLFASYSAGGTVPLRPDLMLRMVLIEMQQGRFRPAQWFRDACEHTPLMWAGYGLRPSRTAWYEFAERIAPWLDDWNRQLIQAAKHAEVTSATRGALDGSSVAANASRHRLLNEDRLTTRHSELEQARTADETGQPPESVPGWMAKTPEGRTAQEERYRQAQIRLKELQAVNERQPPKRQRPRNRVVVSASDPQAALGRDKLNVFRPLYNVQLLRDLDSPLILGYDVLAQPTDAGALRPMLKKLRNTFDVHLESLLVDAGYVDACNLARCEREQVKLYGPWQENDYTAGNKNGTPGRFSRDDFEWLPEENAYRCPQGHVLTAIGKERRQQSQGEIQTVYRYRCLPKHCRACPLRERCTSSPARGRSVRRSEYEELIVEHQARMQTAESKTLYRQRRQTVELSFADFKEHRNFQRMSGRGLHHAMAQTALTVLAHNLTVLSHALHPDTPPPDPG
jgi:Transposase DDE domain